MSSVWSLVASSSAEICVVPGHVVGDGRVADGVDVDDFAGLGDLALVVPVAQGHEDECLLIRGAELLAPDLGLERINAHRASSLPSSGRFGCPL
jgi:hypothetical protein